MKKKIFLTKLKIMMLFISPKRKITILEMSLKSSIMSKIWKRVASSFCKVLVNLTGWKTELLIAQLRAGIWQKVFRLMSGSRFSTSKYQKWCLFIFSQKYQNFAKNAKYFFFLVGLKYPWGHILSLRTFRQIPVLSWAISNSVFWQN